MKRTILAVMLALALVLIPMSAALAQDEQVTVTALPTVVSFVASPDTWTINGITGSGSIWPNTTYYANPTGDRTAPNNPVVAGDCYFDFTNNGSVAIAISCDMTDFSGGSDPMTNSEGGYTVNGATDYGASGYEVGDTWPGDAEDFLTTGSGIFIESLAAAASTDWGVALITQTNAFTGTVASTATIDCYGSEP